jgi:hypothetical protein
LNRTVLLNDSTDAILADEEGSAANPSSSSESEAENGRNDPDPTELPLDGLAGGLSVVIGDGDRGDVGEDGEEDDEVDADGLVLDEHVEEEEDLEVKAEGDTVDLSKRRKRRK